jgi:serine/threonine protein kinase
MKDILSGLNLMHEKNFVHRDLKPENILINIENHGKQTLVAKIADFGLSAEYKINLFTSENMDEKMGTILYMAPE